MQIKQAREAMFIAVEMEKTAVETYERALWLMSGADRRSEPLYAMLQATLSDEKRHLQRFSSLAKPLEHEQENTLLLQAQAADVLFPGGLMGAARKGMLDSVEAMMTFAIESERQAAAKYREFADACEDEQAKNALLAIASEEDEHLRALELRAAKR